MSDLRCALRALQRSPRNTIVAVAILALGIGMNTAMFSGINHVLLRPLPFPDAGRLMRLRDQITDTRGQRHPFNMSSKSAGTVREAADVFEVVAAFSGENMTMAGGDVPERLSVVRLTDGADRVLGVRPALGRWFNDEELRAGDGGGVALVSDALWHTRLGGSSAVVGSRIQLDDRPYTVIGVMPPRFAFPYRAQVWVPHRLDPGDQARDFAVLARLKPGVTRRQMLDSLDRVAARVRASQSMTGVYAVEVTPIRENLVGSQDAPLRALTAVVACLLLIACVNVATLLLASAVGRRREFAIRAALGASRLRHIRQLLAETFLLSAAGCAAGLLLAAWMAPLTSRLVPSVLGDELGLVELRTDWRVAAFAVAAALVSAVLAAVMPALAGWRTDPQAALVDRTRASTSRSGGRLLGALVVAETALTMLLLVGAGLVIRQFVQLQREPLGFDARGLLTMELVPPVSRYAPGDARARLVAAIVDEVRAEPGVVGAAATTVNPLGGGTWGAPVVTEDDPTGDASAGTNVNYRLITPGLFDAMRIPLRRGRDFTQLDRAGSPLVAVVSERMARRLWPDQDPIGRRARIARPGQPWVTVVGVAGDVSDSHFPGVPYETWYLPFAQNAGSFAAERIYLMVRTGGSALSLVPSVQRAILRVDKTLAPYAPAAMDAYHSDTIVRERVGAQFMLGFGAFGLALAALGVYGVMAFSVAQRKTELGIRLALGATVGQIVSLVLRGSVAGVGGGIALGASMAAALNRPLSVLLPDIGSPDAAILIGATALIGLTAAAACLIPAMAASRLDPIVALRTD